jgi:hypothetical protein
MNLPNRRHVLALGALAPLAPALAAPLVVDLDAPGALARLRSEQPARYEKVAALLRDAERLPETQVEGWIRTRYDADAVQLGQMLLVSYRRSGASRSRSRRWRTSRRSCRAAAGEIVPAR